MYKSIASLFVSFLLVMSMAVAESAQQVPMPPKFSPDANSEETLANYPLDRIDKMAAFVHHGSAARTVTLPNGMEGWVYELHPVGNSKTYVQANGTGVRINETAEHPALAAYTLVFDSRGTVVDVLYATADRHNPNSALLIQRSRAGDKPRAAWVPGASK